MYPSDLTDPQWETLIEHCPFLIEPNPRGGRPRRHAVRLVLDAVLYVDKTGCQWRQLPHEYPPWKTVYTTFRRWRLNGTWNRVHAVLREAVRRRAGKLVQPSVAIVDSQSAKTVQKGGAAVMTRARE